MERKNLSLICDGLTVCRVMVGVALVVTGFLMEQRGIRIAIVLLLLGWTTDIFDGRIARAIKKEETLIGANDLKFDTLMIIGAVVYLGCGHFIPSLLSAVWALGLLILIIFPFSYSFLWLFESMTTIFIFIFLIYKGTAIMVIIMLSWGMAMLIYDWQRAMTIWKEQLDVARQFLKIQPH